MYIQESSTLKPILGNQVLIDCKQSVMIFLYPWSDFDVCVFV